MLRTNFNLLVQIVTKTRNQKKTLVSTRVIERTCKFSCYGLIEYVWLDCYILECDCIIIDSSFIANFYELLREEGRFHHNLLVSFDYLSLDFVLNIGFNTVAVV